MTYAEQRDARRSADANFSKHDFSWEEEHCPSLHSGLMEPLPNRPGYGALFVSLWVSNGSYRVRIQDRSVDEKAFLDVGTLENVFSKIDEALLGDSLDWTPDKVARTGRNGT